MLAPWAVDITDRLDLDQLCKLVVERDIEAAFADRADSEPFVTALRASVEENVATLRAVLNGSLSIDAVQLDRPILLGALQAQLRIPQSAMQHSYRVGFAVMWEAWSTALTEEVPEQEVGDLAGQVVELTRLILSYQDHVALQVSERLSAEEQALAMSRTHVRHRLVESVLRDPTAVLSPADQTTVGYSFDQHHLAVLLPTMAEGAAARLAVSMAAAARTRNALVLPRDLHTSVIWVGRAAPWTEQNLRDLREYLRTLDVVATLGDPAAGIDGFRQSLAQAREAEEIRVAWGVESSPRILSYTEVGLEVLLLRDRSRAERFVAEELGELAAESAESERLRETLEVSYRLGSHVATAAELHVHEHTVRNRLRKIESLLGHPLSERSTEAQVALRLARLL